MINFQYARATDVAGANVFERAGHHPAISRIAATMFG